MASKDRIQRLKEDIRTNILGASMEIAREDGWPALSMRKIADRIEYTAPTIYEYFLNKEAILTELTRQGFLMLAKHMKAAKARFQAAGEQLEAMWMAYWDFAFAEKELYQVMFGVDVNCCHRGADMPEAEMPAAISSEVIRDLIKPRIPGSEEISIKYYTLWSMVHGLIAINMVGQQPSEHITREVLKTAVGSVISSITN